MYGEGAGRGNDEHSPGLMAHALLASLGFCRRFSDALAGVVVTPLPSVSDSHNTIPITFFTTLGHNVMCNNAAQNNLY